MDEEIRKVMVALKESIDSLLRPNVEYAILTFDDAAVKEGKADRVEEVMKTSGWELISSFANYNFYKDGVLRPRLDSGMTVLTFKRGFAKSDVLAAALNVCEDVVRHESYTADDAGDFYDAIITAAKDVLAKSKPVQHWGGTIFPSPERYENLQLIAPAGEKMLPYAFVQMAGRAKRNTSGDWTKYTEPYAADGERIAIEGNVFPGRDEAVSPYSHRAALPDGTVIRLEDGRQYRVAMTGPTWEGERETVATFHEGSDGSHYWTAANYETRFYGGDFVASHRYRMARVLSTEP